MWGYRFRDTKEDCCEASCWDLTNIVGFIAAASESYTNSSILTHMQPRGSTSRRRATAWVARAVFLLLLPHPENEAPALPSLAGLGCASSGTIAAHAGGRSHRNLAQLVPLTGGSMRPGRVSSRVCEMLLVEGVSVRRRAALRRHRIGTLLVGLSPRYAFRVAMRLWRASRIARPEED